MTTLAEQANRATLREASELLDVPYRTILHAAMKGWIKATKEARVIETRHYQGRRTALVYIVDLEEVEARYCYQPPVITDPVQLAKERGIKYRSAVRHLQRKGLL